MELKNLYNEVINSFHNKKILVVGDLMLDVYLKGVSTRLSPEAPVPVVDVMERHVVLGGSANTVCNLRALGAKVDFFTVIGMDSEGDEALKLLENLPIDIHTVIRSHQRRTIVKTRVVAGTHVITRFDTGTEAPLDEAMTNVMTRMIERCYEQYDAVIISDYDKGIITDTLLDSFAFLQDQYQKFLAIDSKRLQFFKRLHPTLVKPNYDEAVRLLNLNPLLAGRSEQIESQSQHLYNEIPAQIIAATIDSEGSVIIERGQVVHKLPAPVIANPSVSGAGDTYLSAFVLSHIACSNISTCAEIATAAASIAVKKESTSSCSNNELKCHFNLKTKFISNIEDLVELAEAYKSDNKKIVFTNGCFDILHSGHVTYLHCAKELGDVLIVGINSDDSIKRLKGDVRPINPLHDRLQVLSALSSIDHIIAFGDEHNDTPVSLIEAVKPDIFVKGGDYTKAKLPEAETVERLGGKIMFLPHIPDHSTTEIIKRISNSATSDQAIISSYQ